MNYLAFLRTFEPRDCTLVPNFLFLVRLTPSRKLELSNSPSNYVRVMLLYFFHLFPRDFPFRMEYEAGLLCSNLLYSALLESLCSVLPCGLPEISGMLLSREH
jgi:hypothetical protein